jgi:8-oxo-dGTP diphosphatase
MSNPFTFTTMSLIIDKYDGVTINSSTIPDDINEFENEIISIIKNLNNKKLLWIKLPIEKSNFIPILTKHDFIFHDCNDTDLTLIKKLIKNPIIPTATTHTLGVGAVVINENKLLVIKDRYQIGYKLPGGHIDKDEEICEALKREVLEETGVKIEFESIISLGHFSPAQFGESNLYVVCSAKALSYDINIQDTQEILEAKWIDIDEYFNSDDIHKYNKDIVQTAIKNEGLQLETHEYFSRPNKKYEFFF